MKTPIILAVIGLAAAIAFSTAGVLAYRWISAPARGAVEQREITNQGQYRIQAYEQFYRWQEQLDAIEAKLSAYPETGLDLRRQTECRGCWRSGPTSSPSTTPPPGPSAPRPNGSTPACPTPWSIPRRKSADDPAPQDRK